VLLLVEVEAHAAQIEGRLPRGRLGRWLLPKRLGYVVVVQAGLALIPISQTETLMSAYCGPMLVRRWASLAHFNQRLPCCQTFGG
jgi:hypothetical protein